MINIGNRRKIFLNSWECLLKPATKLLSTNDYTKCPFKSISSSFYDKMPFVPLKECCFGNLKLYLQIGSNWFLGVFRPALLVMAESLLLRAFYTQKGILRHITTFWRFSMMIKLYTLLVRQSYTDTIEKSIGLRFISLIHILFHNVVLNLYLFKNIKEKRTEKYITYINWAYWEIM